MKWYKEIKRTGLFSQTKGKYKSSLLSNQELGLDFSLPCGSLSCHHGAENDVEYELLTYLTTESLGTCSEVG